MAYQSYQKRLHQEKKPIPEQRDESWVEERNHSKKAAKMTPDGDNMFETQERTIVWVDRARITQKSAKNDHAWQEFFDLANKCLHLGWYL